LSALVPHPHPLPSTLCFYSPLALLTAASNVLPSAAAVVRASSHPQPPRASWVPLAVQVNERPNVSLREMD
jgi:hypothetical protein